MQISFKSPSPNKDIFAALAGGIERKFSDINQDLQTIYDKTDEDKFDLDGLKEDSDDMLTSEASLTFLSSHKSA